MILLVDNYDSFSYNLYQFVGTINPDIKVIRNDEMSVKEIEELNPSHIIISPGPGRPSDAGECENIISYFKDKVPMLGVCLGHQAICEVFGAKVTYAEKLMHGKQSEIEILEKEPIFEKFADQEHIKVARYHSLAADPESIPAELKVTARTKEGEVMAVKHREYNVFGVQFHPESILTPNGIKIINNFLNI